MYICFVTVIELSLYIYIYIYKPLSELYDGEKNLLHHKCLGFLFLKNVDKPATFCSAIIVVTFERERERKRERVYLHI